VSVAGPGRSACASLSRSHTPLWRTTL